MDFLYRTSKSATKLRTILSHLQPSSSTSSTFSTTTCSSELPSYIRVHPDVSEALRKGRPVVALESTIVSHGMPWPDNYKTAKEVEEVVRSEGAVPATIAILNGIVHIGLSEDALKILAQSGLQAQKVSRRDIAHVIGTKGTGGTTVAATSLLAAKVGIRLFATGGIGGVHRDGENSMDVSADLIELSKTSIAVVCAGVKSLLDIGRTLEVLETQGVTVVSFKSKQFPAFFVPDSGHAAPRSVSSAQECAKMIHANLEMKLGSGMIVAVPIAEKDASDSSVVEAAIQQAIKQARQENIKGKDITPFLLDRVNQLTHGASLKSNIALIKNNARVASRIAVSLSQLQKQQNV